MENQDDRTTIGSIMGKSKSESKQHDRNQSQTQSDTSESPHSPLPIPSPLPTDHKPPFEPSPNSSPEDYYSKAIVPVDNKYLHYSPHRSPSPERKNSQDNMNSQAEKVQSPVVVFNRSTREQNSTVVTKVGPGGGEEGRGGRRVKGRGFNTRASRSSNEEMVNRTALGIRICEVVLCLISFSVMAADKTQGWAGDSFDRYKEYRYCLSVTVIAFAYSGFQAFDSAYHWIMGKHLIQHHLRYHFDFFMDQVLAYLLISASSSAVARVDDWQMNWGKDEFTEMATASISMAFLAFVTFALSSLISGYNLCNRNIDVA